MKQGIFAWAIHAIQSINAPVTFMTLLDDVLRPLLDSFIIVYLDNILVINKPWEEHLQLLDMVLQTL